MSSSEASSSTVATSASIVYNGVLKIRNAISKETCATIYYEKPYIEEITKCENPFDLKISYDGETLTIKSYVQNLKNASKGIYYGPFPISELENNQEFDFYFPEESCPEHAKWSPNIDKYVVTESAYKQCDLSLAPTRVLPEFGPSSTSDSESQAFPLFDPHFLSLPHPKYGFIFYRKKVPVMSCGKSALKYVKPLEEDMKKCRKAFPLQLERPDGSFNIVPCFAEINPNCPRHPDTCRFAIEVRKDNGDVTHMECYIPDVPSLLEIPSDSIYGYLVENMKNAHKGVYYGPYEIAVDDGYRTAKKFKCYITEKMFKQQTEYNKENPNCFWAIDSSFAPNIDKYVVTESAYKQCDLSLAPTRILPEFGPSFTSNSESLALSLIDPNSSNSESLALSLIDPNFLSLPHHKFGKIRLETLNPEMRHNTVRYVIPLIDDMKKCPSNRAFPLQLLVYRNSYIIVPCFTPESENFPVGSDPCRFAIEVRKDNADVTHMECYIPDVPSLLEIPSDSQQQKRLGININAGLEMTPNYTSYCNYTIHKKDGTKVKKSFEYIIPSQNDVENGKNHFELEIFNGVKLTRVRLYIGDISSFVRKKYIGPYLIEENKTDGTRGWLNCYFEKGSIYHLNEDVIKCREQELILEKDEFESQRDVFLGTDKPRSDTEVKCFKKNGVRSFHVFRTIEEHDMTGDVLSGSEI